MTIFRTFEVALRRRWLLITPFLIMLPVSVAATQFIGGGYVARSLVMLQQQVASNPLAHESNELNADRLAQMLKGLRALLASDYVLAPVVEDPDGQPLDPVTRASRVKELARNVSVDLLGNDFIEFRLAGGKAQGLGDRLQSIMTNLIGALVAPPGETAGLFAVRSLEEKLQSAEKKVAALDARLDALLPPGLDVAVMELNGWERLSASLRDQVAALDRADSASGSTAQKRAVFDDRKVLQARLAEVAGQIPELGRKISEYRTAAAERDDLAATVAKLRARAASEKARLGGEAAASWAAMINAPERMIVVDPPRDPELRTNSRLYFVVSGAFGGILLGIALVILAEIFDTTLRTPEQMVAVAHVTCLGSLPLLISGSRERRSAVETAHAGVGRLFSPQARLEDRHLHHEA